MQTGKAHMLASTQAQFDMGLRVSDSPMCTTHLSANVGQQQLCPCNRNRILPAFHCKALRLPLPHLSTRLAPLCSRVPLCCSMAWSRPPRLTRWCTSSMLPLASTTAHRSSRSASNCSITCTRHTAATADMAQQRQGTRPRRIRRTAAAHAVMPCVGGGCPWHVENAMA